MKRTRPENSVLVIIDIQDRLLAKIPTAATLVQNAGFLLDVAALLEVPIRATEQYPKGLGHTLQEVKDALPAGVQPVEKVAFSCLGADAFRSRLAATGARQLLLAGIEAHVCVLMSALDLLAEGFAVHIVADAVTSRTQANWRLAMAQLRQAGAVVTTTETVLFQLLRQADTDDFRELARLIR